MKRIGVIPGRGNCLFNSNESIVKIFSAEQIKSWDNYTITHEPVAPGQLMERAAEACRQWLISHFSGAAFKIFCGKGNNGGDGLAIARMLIEGKCAVSVYIVGSAAPGSDDFQNNLERLYACTNDISFIQTGKSFPETGAGDIIIDALFGTGLNKPPGDTAALVIEHINQSGALVISIDMPSGLYTDKSSADNHIVKADYTLTFQQYKLAFMMAENEACFGKIVVLEINLHREYYEQTDAQCELVDVSLIKAIYMPRRPFSNKGDFGHACLLAGSYGMMGAAVLAAKACVKSGAGKLTCIVCKEGYEIMQISVPEAMCKIYGDTFVTGFEDYVNFNVAGIGPGIGIHDSHHGLLQQLFTGINGTAVIDADALNVLANNKRLLSALPENCIITPHPKEFDRLFGKTANDFERMQLALQKSQEYKIYIVLKGHHTLITTPYKRAYFNSTGNSGMAKGGSGDVLTGILTGIVAQGYPSLEACLLGVYLHGLAGDLAAEKFSQEAMLASDIIDCLGDAYKDLAR